MTWAEVIACIGCYVMFSLFTTDVNLFRFKQTHWRRMSFVYSVKIVLVLGEYFLEVWLLRGRSWISLLRATIIGSDRYFIFQQVYLYLLLIRRWWTCWGSRRQLVWRPDFCPNKSASFANENLFLQCVHHLEIWTSVSEAEGESLKKPSRKAGLNGRNWLFVTPMMIIKCLNIHIIYFNFFFYSFGFIRGRGAEGGFQYNTIQQFNTSIQHQHPNTVAAAQPALPFFYQVRRSYKKWGWALSKMFHHRTPYTATIENTKTVHRHCFFRHPVRFLSFFVVYTNIFF